MLSPICGGDSIVYVQCDIMVPENAEENFETFPPILEKTLASRLDIGEFMKGLGEENTLLSQPRRVLISNFRFTNRTISRPLFNFLSEFWSQMYLKPSFIQYTLFRCFNSFVLSALSALKLGDEK